MATRGKESGKYSMISGIYICKLDGSVMKRLSESSWIEKEKIDVMKLRRR